MNRQKWTILVAALVLIGGTGLTLNYLRQHQKLGQPGVKSTPIAGSPRLNLYLPEQVLDYTSTNIPTETNLLNGLPHDTSFVARLYQDPVTNCVLMRIVMMGTDRSSIHKPEFCLTGVGWNIDSQEYDTVHVDGARPHDMPVKRLMASREAKVNGKDVTYRAIYVYWFVADDDLTASHWARMTKTAGHLLRTGELERWAYVSAFAVCAPGHENTAVERLKKFIAASVPQFQLASAAGGSDSRWTQTAARTGSH